MNRPLRALTAALVLLGVLGTSCTGSTGGDGRLATIAAAPPEATPAPSAPPAPSGGSDEDGSLCPRIIDAAARLSYDCLDPAFAEIPGTADPAFAEGGVRIGAYTEPAWVAAQQSGALVTGGATAQVTALLLASQQTGDNYGPGATSATQSGASIEGLGLSAFRIDLIVTLDPAYAQQRGLSMLTERLCIVVVETGAGAYSALMISVPDTRADLWAAYDSVVASLAAT